jgi:hypothetical protein
MILVESYQTFFVLVSYCTLGLNKQVAHIAIDLSAIHRHEYT